MRKTFEACFDGNVLVPKEPLKLAPGTQCVVEIETCNVAGPFADLAQFATDLPDAPSDLAAQHDHYLYESPKR